MNDKTDQPELRSFDQVLAWIKRQFLNWQFIGFVVAIGLSIYLFFAGQKIPEVSYQMSVVQVFNAESSSQSIVLTDLAGRKIESNVYAAEIVIWNSGNAPVAKEDVRQPIKIKATNGAGILGYEFLAETSAGVSHFTVGKTSLEKPTSQEFELHLGTFKFPGSVFETPFTLPELNIDWRFFDEAQGFRVRVLFMAAWYRHLIVVGSIYPAGDVVDRTPRTAALRSSMVMRAINLIVITAMFGIVFITANVVTFKALYAKFQKQRKPSIWIIQIIVLASTIYAAYLASDSVLVNIRTLVSPPI